MQKQFITLPFLFLKVRSCLFCHNNPGKHFDNGSTRILDILLVHQEVVIVKLSKPINNTMRESQVTMSLLFYTLHVFLSEGNLIYPFNLHNLENKPLLLPLDDVSWNIQDESLVNNLRSPNWMLVIKFLGILRSVFLIL